MIINTKTNAQLTSTTSAYLRKKFEKYLDGFYSPITKIQEFQCNLSNNKHPVEDEVSDTLARQHQDHKSG